MDLPLDGASELAVLTHCCSPSSLSRYLGRRPLFAFSSWNNGYLLSAVYPSRDMRVSHGAHHKIKEVAKRGMATQRAGACGMPRNILRELT